MGNKPETRFANPALNAAFDKANALNTAVVESKRRSAGVEKATKGKPAGNLIRYWQPEYVTRFNGPNGSMIKAHETNDHRIIGGIAQSEGKPLEKDNYTRRERMARKAIAKQWNKDRRERQKWDLIADNRKFALQGKGDRQLHTRALPIRIASALVANVLPR